MKQLDGVLGQAHIQRLMDQGMGHTVVVVIHDDVIVDVDRRHGPRGQLERLGRQGQQLVLFLGVKPLVARAVEFLKRLGVELSQQRPHRLVQRGDTEEALMAQDRQDLALYDLHARFHFGFVPRFFYPRRQDHGAVVLGQFLVRAVQLGFVAARSRDRRPGIVWHRGFGDPAKKVIRVDVASDPRRQLLVRERLHKGLVARAEHGHEHMRGGERAGGRIVNRHRLPGPVHEQLLARPMHLPQHRIEFRRPLPIQLAETAVGITRRLRLPILLPQQLQRHPFAAEFFPQVRPVRHRFSHRTGDRCRCPAQQLGLQLLLAEFRRQRPTQAHGGRALQVVAHGTGGQAATPGDLPHREPVLMFEAENVFDRTHG